VKAAALNITLILFTMELNGNGSGGHLYSRDQKPNRPLQYYAEQSNRYFDTLDTYAPRRSKPRFSSHVIRWEWPPWLFLTGHKDHWMAFDAILPLFPTRVLNRDCRGFDVQPFGRCRVTFHYIWADAYVDIYQEFTFNASGEITFIEAWTDEDGYRPMSPAVDFWAEGPDVSRLSTRVPGLGRPDGRYQMDVLREMAVHDPDLRDLHARLQMPIVAWMFEAVRFTFQDYHGQSTRIAAVAGHPVPAGGL